MKRTAPLALTLVLTAAATSCQRPAAPAARPVAVAPAPKPAPGAEPSMQAAVDDARRELLARHGEAQRARIEQGLRQVARLWRATDGDARAFAAFANAQFAADQASLDALFQRFEFVLESLVGHGSEMARDLRWYAELDLGPEQPVDALTSAFDPMAHLTEDSFSSKLGFAALLNFPITTLEQRLNEGETWSRRKWAEAWLVERFTRRIPADVLQAVAEATADGERYIAGLNFWMHHVLDKNGRRLFPPGMRLLSHWNLRDEIKSQYGQPDGIDRQRTLQALMERIAAQQVPAIFIDNPLVDFSPFHPEIVTRSPENDSDRKAPASFALESAPEPDTRYAKLLAHFQAARRVDRVSPTAPTLFARSFDEDRQMSEARVKELLETVCKSPLLGKVARLIEQRLGRKLEPFDIWYSGFSGKAGPDVRKLDEMVRARYPNAEAYKKDMPNLLRTLGFSAEKAAWLSDRIEVDPARGSGHALEAERRGDKARLRTRVGKNGMDYKGFNIAVHEMGHNVEQVVSLYGVDHWLLRGVPNTAFTEAIAFRFQARDTELLGLPPRDRNARAERVLHEFWETVEIAGVALVDMAVWRWMYAHPEATPAELKEAVLSRARDVWNRYYAPVFGQKDSILFAIYSHMINTPLYLPDYALGHFAAFQIAQQLEKTGRFGDEIERMCRIGRVSPDLWMKQATGRPLGPEALLEATGAALEARGK